MYVVLTNNAAKSRAKGRTVECGGAESGGGELARQAPPRSRNRNASDVFQILRHNFRQAPPVVMNPTPTDTAYMIVTSSKMLDERYAGKARLDDDHVDESEDSLKAEVNAKEAQSDARNMKSRSSRTMIVMVPLASST